MGNQHYSIFVAEDNVDDIIHHFNELYFGIEESITLCDHSLSLSPRDKKQDVYIQRNQIILSEKSIEKMIKACLYLKKGDENTPLELRFSSHKSSSFTLILSF